MVSTHYLVNQLTLTIAVIDKCQKAYHMTVKKLDCLPGNVS